jgi:hypothetical protein
MEFLWFTQHKNISGNAVGWKDRTEVVTLVWGHDGGSLVDNIAHTTMTGGGAPADVL